MNTPIDSLLDGVNWEPTGITGLAGGLPHATHSGVLEIGGISLRCYRLSTGVAVFDAEDIERFFGGLL